MLNIISDLVVWGFLNLIQLRGKRGGFVSLFFFSFSGLDRGLRANKRKSNHSASCCYIIPPCAYSKMLPRCVDAAVFYS